jgi:hypothetical protein
MRRRRSAIKTIFGISSFANDYFGTCAIAHGGRCGIFQNSIGFGSRYKLSLLSATRTEIRASQFRHLVPPWVRDGKAHVSIRRLRQVCPLGHCCSSLHDLDMLVLRVNRLGPAVIGQFARHGFSIRIDSPLIVLEIFRSPRFDVDRHRHARYFIRFIPQFQGLSGSHRMNM